MKEHYSPRDRLVCGLSSPKILKFIIDYKKLTFAQANDIEVSMELAEENAKFIIDSLGKSNVLKLKDTYKSPVTDADENALMSMLKHKLL